jgi:hypothetical protein
MRGFGVAQNFNLAMTWLKKAAAQNDSVAQNSIGVLYRDGAGVKADCRQAIKWFQLSAAQHNYWGEDDLGGLYARGQCEKQDGALALTYFQKAAQDGYANAYQDINDLAARMMLAKQFAEALKDAKVAITLSPPDDLMAQLEEAEAMMMAGQIDDARSIYLKNMGKPACPGCQAWQDVIKAHFAAMRKQGLSSPLMTEIETAIAAPSAPTAQSHPSPKAP